MVLAALLGVALGGLCAWLGYRAGLLTVPGAWALVAAVVIAFVNGGWVWGLLLLLSLVTIGLWARFRADYKSTLGDRFCQGRSRGWVQILARVGWAAFLAVLYGLCTRERGLLIGFVGALAASTADAWGTEVGVLSNQTPRLLLSRRYAGLPQVPTGTAGGISTLGLVAGLGGSWLMGFSGLLLSAAKAWLTDIALDPALLWLPLAAMIGGMAGSLTDSLLGASAQGIYYCEHCKQRSESRQHACGRQADQIRGWAWLTNDGVNVVCSLVGAAVAVGAATWLARFSGQW